MKKTLAILLAAIMMVSLFAICASAAKNENEYDRVMASGKLVVATSADYEPYEYVDDDGEFVGFDMDLIREIGARLGLEVEIIDMNFDSVVAAVQSGKADCAIAAMGETEERREQVDFTQMYHQQANVFYVRSDSDITLEGKNDIVEYKTGVQSGSMLDDFLTGLAEEGLMKEKNISRYERIEDAMLDLEAGRIQVVMGDAAGMAATLASYDCKVILKEQIYDTGENIIVGKDQPEMVAAIDEILDDLFEEGYIEDLMAQYGIE